MFEIKPWENQNLKVTIFELTPRTPTTIKFLAYRPRFFGTRPGNVGTRPGNFGTRPGNSDKNQIKQLDKTYISLYETYTLVVK